MNHVITVGDLLVWIIVAGGAVGVIAFILWVILVLCNPWSNGH